MSHIDEVNHELPGRTFLKSKAHARVRESKGSYVRSVAVGLQFGLFYLPGEILEVVIWPLIKDFFMLIYYTINSLQSVLISSAAGLCMGLQGFLDATDEPYIEELDEDG